MRMPLLWLNLMLATILGLTYAQPDLFKPVQKPDYVLVAPTPIGGGKAYSEMVRGADNFSRDWQKRVVVLPSGSGPDELAVALKQAVALEPRGVSLPGSNDEILLPFVTEAQRRGIKVTFHTSPSAPAAARFGDLGTGYVGTHSQADGEFAARAALQRIPDTANLNVLVVGTAGSTAPGTRLSGCVNYLEEQGIPVEALEITLPKQLGEPMDPSLTQRLSAPTPPGLILWDAGAVSQLTSALFLMGMEPGAVNVATFDTETAVQIAEQVFIKRQFFEQRTLAAYISLLQLYLSDHHGVAGLHVPIYASL